MKKIYTIAAGLLLSASFVSCELKDEILGKGEVPVETGWVELGVQVDNRTNVSITRAAADDAGEGQDTQVDPYNFPISFTHQSAEYEKAFDTYEEMRKTESIELPIGTYTVTAHTPGEMKKEMDHAYYLGKIDDLTVTSGKTAQATVECTMQNSRILLAFDPKFLDAFDPWTITLDDASDKVLTYTEEDGTTLEAVYWAIAENCSAIKVNITATTAAGETVHESRTITKPDGAATQYCTVGDALEITMKPSDKPSTPDPDDPDNPGEPEKPNGVSGIEITVDAFFETPENEVVEVPIEGEDSGDDTPTEPTDPDEGEEGGDEPTTGNKATISLPNNGEIVYTVGGIGAPNKAPVTISVPEKFKSLTVKITAGNAGFAEAVGAIDLDKGINIMNLDLEDPINQVLVKALGSIPTEDDDEYSLDIAGFYSMMDTYGATVGEDNDDGRNSHEFEITVEDQAGNPAVTATLKVTINPASAAE